MNLDKQYAQARALYQSAVAQYGEKSRTAKFLHKEFVKVTNRLFKRNNDIEKRDRRKAA